MYVKTTIPTGSLPGDVFTFSACGVTLFTIVPPGECPEAKAMWMRWRSVRKRTIRHHARLCGITSADSTASCVAPAPTGCAGGDAMEVEFPDIFNSEAQILVRTTAITVTQHTMQTAASPVTGNEPLVTVSTCATTTSDTVRQMVPGGADFLERLASAECVTRDEVRVDWNEQAPVAMGVPITDPSAARQLGSPRENLEKMQIAAVRALGQSASELEEDVGERPYRRQRQRWRIRGWNLHWLWGSRERGRSGPSPRPRVSV